MNRTLLTLTGLLLAAPLAAQHPSANEIKASELLQLSAQKAMAGYETEATKLAEMAMELLASKASSVEGEIRMVIEENDGHLKGHVVIVDGPNGREVIEYIDSEDVVVETQVEARMQPLLLALQNLETQPLDLDGEFEGGRNYWHNVIEDGEENMEVIVLRSPHEQDGGEWRTVQGGNHHFAPMNGGDLHQQLRDIQHELESLRHELHALRSSMNGGGRGGMQGQRRVMRFNERGGNWFSEGNRNLRGGGRIHLQNDFLPGQIQRGQIQRIELHGTEGFPQDMRLRGLQGLGEIMELRGMSGTVDIEGWRELGGMDQPHKLHFPGDQGSNLDFDFGLDVPEGVEVQKEVIVIVNGEKFTGDAAMKKLEELNMAEMGIESKIQMRLMGKSGTFPTPPEPPQTPQQGHWRSLGHEHEDA